MEDLHVEIKSKSLFSVLPFKITLTVGCLSITKLFCAYFPRRQKRVVVLQPQDTVIVFFAKIFQGRNGMAVEMIAELKVGIELHHKSEGRRDVFVDLCDHQTWPEV